MSKRSKQRKTTKAIKLRWIACIWHQNDLKCWGSRKTFKTTQNYKSNQITINCIDLMSKTSKQSKTTKAIKLLELHRFDVKTIKRRKTTKASKLRWIACIWHQNERKCCVRSQTIQNNAKLQKWSKYNDLHRFDVKSDQVTMNLHRFGVKTS